MTSLNPQMVMDVLQDCMSDETEGKTDQEVLAMVEAGTLVKVEGIMGIFIFDPENLKAAKQEIQEMAACMNDQFFMDSGGGWTFLNLCEDRDGVLWTGEHRVCEMLCVLMIGAGIAKWVLPREMWQMLPGGMPYIGILPQREWAA